MYNTEFDFKYTPGNGGKNCPGNGESRDKNGILIECCCDECDYYLCCIDENFEKYCQNCTEYKCVHNKYEEL